MTKSRSPFNFGKGLGFRNQNRVGSMGPFSHVLIKSSFLIAKLSILLSFSCRRCLLMVFTSTQCVVGHELILHSALRRNKTRSGGDSFVSFSLPWYRKREPTTSWPAVYPPWTGKGSCLELFFQFFGPFSSLFRPFPQQSSPRPKLFSFLSKKKSKVFEKGLTRNVTWTML